MGQLSEQGQRVQNVFKKLSRQDRAEIINQGLTALAAEVAEAAPTAAPAVRAQAHAELTQAVAAQLIEEAGGIFLGEKQLKELRVLPQFLSIAPIPEKFSKAFLNAKHPVRGGRIAEHIILGFDPEIGQWYCFEKSIVPGSLGKKGRGLSSFRQVNLLLDKKDKPYTVEGMKYSSPEDYRPIKGVLDNVIKLQLNNGVKEKDLPFYGNFGRTADIHRAASGCAVILSCDRCGSIVHFDCSLFDAYLNVGLLAGWN